MLLTINNSQLKISPLKYILLFLFLGILSACSFNSNKQNTGAAYLQGEWQEANIPFAADLVEYEQHHFKFTCDSFYLVLDNFSKADFAQDTCYRNDKWKEYVKGTYNISGDTLHLKGAYSSKNFKLKISPCYSTGIYEERLLLQSKTDSVLIFKSFTTGQMVLKLQKRLYCTPKSL
jgi:hypothetical protein